MSPLPELSSGAGAFTLMYTEQATDCFSPPRSRSWDYGRINSTAPIRAGPWDNRLPADSPRMLVRHPTGCPISFSGAQKGDRMRTLRYSLAIVAVALASAGYALAAVTPN